MDNKLKEVQQGDFVDDTVVTIAEPRSSTQFVGLTREELRNFEHDPFWKRIRLGLFIGFWAIWCILLVAAILILVYTPKCPEVIKVAFSRQYAGYAIDRAKFVQPMQPSNRDIAADFTEIGQRLADIKAIGFGYIVLHDSEVLNGIRSSEGSASDVNDVVLNSCKNLCKTAANKGLRTVLALDCSELKCSDFNNDDKANTLVDLVLQDMKFDGIYLIRPGDENISFEKTVEQINERVRYIGKRTMKERNLIVEGTEQQVNDKNGGIKQSNDDNLAVSLALSKWTQSDLASDVLKYINGTGGWKLDKIDGDRIASSSRGIDTFIALHVAYLLPGAPIINYGTETFLSNTVCQNLIMPWNSSTYTRDVCGNEIPVQGYQNVKVLSAPGHPNSPYNLTTILSAFRNQNPIFTFGQIHAISQFDEQTISWEIRYHLYNVFKVYINIGDKYSTVSVRDLKREASKSEMDKECHLTVAYQYNTNFIAGQKFPCINEELHLPAKSALVLNSSFVHENQE